MIKRAILKFVVLSILVLQSSCAKAELFAPDYSTPEATFRTFFYATTHKSAELYLECLSEEFRTRNYGASESEQLTKVKIVLQKAITSPDSHYEITKVESNPLDASYVTVTHQQLYKGKVMLSNLRTLLVFENGNWKIAPPEGIVTTPEQIAALKKRDEFMHKKYILDEEKRILVPAEESTKQTGRRPLGRD
jgi:hypothetical protein